MARAKAYHHGDLPPALLDGVAAILRERGLRFVSLREVARRARVSHSAPAHHFRNKSGLLTAFAAQGFQRLAETVAAVVAERRPDNPRDRLAALGCAYVRFALANREQFGIMFRPELLDRTDRSFAQAADGAFGLLARTIADCVAAGYLRREDAHTAGIAAWSLVHGLAALWLGGRLQERVGDVDPNDVAAAVTKLFVGAVLAGEPSPVRPARRPPRAESRRDEPPRRQGRRDRKR